MGMKYPGLLLVFLLPALISSASGAIYVENATVFDFGLNATPVGLSSSLDGVAPRIFTEHVDSLVGKKLIVASGGLNNSLNAVRPRIFTEHVDSLVGENLIVAPVGLNNSLNAVRPRIFMEHIDSLFFNNLNYIPDGLNSSIAAVRPRIFTEHLDSIFKNNLTGTFVEISSIQSSLFIDDAPHGIAVYKAPGDKTDVVIEIKNTGAATKHVRVELKYSILSENGITPEIYSRDGYFGEEIRLTEKDLLSIEIQPNFVKHIIWRFNIPSNEVGKDTLVFGKTFISDELISADQGIIKIVKDSKGIIITNRKLLYERFGKSSESTKADTVSLLNTIYAIADGENEKEIPNVVYYVDRYSSLAANWDQKITYPPWGIISESVNEVANDIDLIIEQKQKILGSNYLTIIGGDEIIPFYRIPDPRINVPFLEDQEKDYKYNSNDPVLTIIDNNYIPTDNIYSDLNGNGLDDWIIPELSIGRISSATAKDMELFIENSLKGPTNNNNNAILATDTTIYNTEAIKTKLDIKTYNVITIPENTNTDMKSGQVAYKLYEILKKNEGYRILSYAGHSNYNMFGHKEDGDYFALQPSDFNAINNNQPIIDNTIYKNNPVITFGGCRIGLVTDEDDTNWNPSWTDNFVWSLSHNGASAILGSGSLNSGSKGGFLEPKVAYSEKLYNNFYEELIQDSHLTKPIGMALRDAEQKYDNGFLPDGRDEKARIQFLLYSIPWMTFDPPITSPKQSKEDFKITITPPEKIDEGTYRRVVTIEVITYNLTSLEGFDLINIEGTSYILNDFKPILPRINAALNLPIGSRIENISIISENKIDLGDLHIPSFQSSNTNNPLNSSLTNISDINGIFPSPRFITTNLTYQGFKNLKINYVPVQYNIDTNETFLFNTTVLEVIYKTTDNIIITDFLSVNTNFNINDLISTNVTLENVGSQASENVHYEFLLKNLFGQILKNYTSSDLNISVGIQQIEANISTIGLRQGSYIAEINILNSTGHMLANSSEYIYLISGRLTNFTVNASSIVQGEKLKFNFDFENYNNTDLMSYGQISIFDQQNNIIDTIRIPSITMSGNSIKNFNKTWNSSNTYPGSYKAELTLSSESSEFGAEDQWFRILNFYNLSFLPSLSSETAYRLNSSSILPIRFTARDNQTGNFISDNSVNVSIINSKGSVIESFNITKGVQINSVEEQYEANFNTSNYPLLTTDEIYSVELRFGIVGDPQSYAIAYFTLVDNTIPNSVSNINSTNGSTWLNFTWTNPRDSDFFHVMLYFNGTFLTNISTPQNYYNFTDLTPDTLYELGTQTVDSSGNVNETWINATGRTLPSSGTTPIVSNPTASHEIPDDTDNEPLWGETAQLNVTVTDDSGVASVTVNLTEVGGLAAKPMTNIGGNIWSTTTNASAGTSPKIYNLTVNATDTLGNSNTSVTIPLRVMKNGDCNGNGAVNSGDATRVYMNTSYPGNPLYPLSSPYVCDVTGNGAVNSGDATRIYMNTSYPGNPLYLLK